jgi:hypothetical protein
VTVAEPGSAARSWSRLPSRLPLPAGVREHFEVRSLLRRMPENHGIPRRRALALTLHGLPARVPLLARADKRVRARVFERDLRRLHDILEDSGLAGRYWLWSGLLLGWAREGRILPHDVRDADIAYSAADDERFAAAVPALVAGGFRPWFSFRGNDGEIPVRMFVRHGAFFEFYRMTDQESGRGPVRRYHLFGHGEDGPVEVAAELPRQELVPFEFLGRTWRKPADHEAELEAQYGDWRTPDTSWSYLDEHTIVSRARWSPPLGPAT